MSQTIKELFLGLTDQEKQEVAKNYQRHFAEREEPDFLPVLQDLYQRLQRPLPAIPMGARLKITSFSEYDNGARLLAAYQEKALADPKAAEEPEYPYYIAENGDKIQGPPLPTLAAEIRRLEAEMANDAWEETYYPDFSYFDGGQPPQLEDFTTEEKFLQAQDAFLYGYAIDFIPIEQLLHLPIELSETDRSRLPVSLILADFLYETYFFGGENVDSMKQELLADVQQEQLDADKLLAKHYNAQQLDAKLAAFFADEHQAQKNSHQDYERGEK
ncbi:hypothetical protein [Enterococcus sp.]|uniref:hypothetical protein n=1 Tax=Enterococcus sp. TaxID=35783 RepID=UPI003C74DB14